MVIQHMNGEIDYVSEIGRGTIFDFYINVGCQKEDLGLSS